MSPSTRKTPFCYIAKQTIQMCRAHQPLSMVTGTVYWTLEPLGLVPSHSDCLPGFTLYPPASPRSPKDPVVPIGRSMELVFGLSESVHRLS